MSNLPIRWLSLREFVERAGEFGCREVLPRCQVSGPRGLVTVRALRSPSGRIVILPATDGDERLTSLVIDRLCRSLAITLELRGGDCGAAPRGTALTDASLSGVGQGGVSVNLTASRLPSGIQRILGVHALWVATNGAEGRRANLSGRDMHGCDLTGAWLNGGDFAGCNLAGAVLRRSQWVLADLSGADLSGADLREADVSGTNFRNANLEGSRLAFARLGAVALSGASGEITGEYWPTEFAGANLRGADLSGASPSARAGGAAGVLSAAATPR